MNFFFIVLKLLCQLHIEAPSMALTQLLRYIPVITLAALHVLVAADGTAMIDLGDMQGAPQHYASGFLYGIPDTPNQIPSHFYTDISFNYGRAGGAQLPATGYLGGVSEYTVSYSPMFPKVFRGRVIQLLTTPLYTAAVSVHAIQL